jgi:hypothetical protein
VIAVRTAESPAPGTPAACATALLQGTLVSNAAFGVALQDAEGHVHKIVWPFGYSARATSAGVVVLNDRGLVVAREGDRVGLGGGEIGNDGTWLACSGIQPTRS